MGMRSKHSICLLLLLYCELLLRAVGRQDLYNNDGDGQFSSQTPLHHQGVKEMFRKRSKEFDTITFALAESDAPLLVTKTLSENTKNNLHEWLFSSSKFKHFNTVSSFVNIEKSNKLTQYCSANDHLCPLLTRRKLEGTCEITVDENMRLDDELQNTCVPVSFSPLWPSPSRSGPSGWVSLSVFFSQYADHCAGCCAARLPISHRIGEKIEVPELMRNFDLTFLDWQNSYLLYLHAFTTFEASSASLQDVARALCVLEGSGNAVVYSPTASVLSVSGQQQAANVESFSGSFEEFDCILVPKSWKLEVLSNASTSLLLLSWQDDVTLSEEFIHRILAEEGSSIHQDKEPGVPVPLSLYMPPNERITPTVWLNEPKLPYIFSRVFFSKLLNLGLEEFVDLIKLDANIFPRLVDCPLKSECFYLLLQIFTELDFNSDGCLNESDLLLLTPAKYEHLSNELDDLIQEVIDVATDQWEEALETRTSTKASQWIEFANRAQEKRRLTAVKTAQRIARGDLSFDEIITIRESLPGLYEELIEYGSIEPVE